MGLLVGLAQWMGTTEPTLTLATTLLSGYLLAFIYRRCIFNLSKEHQWIYFVVSGLGLVVFNYGIYAYHSIVSVLFVYGLIRFMPDKRVSVFLAFVFLMLHLLLGYLHTATDSYDIKWTLPQCILTLRLIGLMWDLYDGDISNDGELSDDQKLTAIKDPPGLLEVAAYTYFFGSFLVGPQFPLSRFRQFVNGDFNDPDTKRPRKNIVPVLLRLVPGLLYMVAHFYFFLILSTDYFLTEQFQNDSFFMKLVYINLWLRFILFRYQAAWLVTEGSCILCGLAWNGVNADSGEELWDGVRNIRLTKFELGCTFQSVIESFNLNTNQWAARYIFKRLKFLGNKTYSHLLTLFFLALWHGFYTGYYACFFFEYVCVMAERQLMELMSRVPKLRDSLSKTLLKYPMWVVKKLVVNTGCAFGLLPFALLSLERWWQVYTDLYFFGYVFYLVGWQMFYAVMINVLPKPKKEKVKQEVHQD